MLDLQGMGPLSLVSSAQRETGSQEWGPLAYTGEAKMGQSRALGAWGTPRSSVSASLLLHPPL